MTVNDGMPEWCASRVARMLNDQGKAANGANVLVLGVAYKQNIDDYRESPALRLIERLENRGCSVTYFDPWVPSYAYKGLMCFKWLIWSLWHARTPTWIMISCKRAHELYSIQRML